MRNHGLRAVKDGWQNAGNRRPTACRSLEESVMTSQRMTNACRLQRTTGLTSTLAVAVLSPLLLLGSGAAAAEPPDATEAAVQAATELKVYRQRVKVDAQVVCRVYERRPIFCDAAVREPIVTALDAEVILRYSTVRIGEQAFDVETTPDGNIRFRADKVNYTGQQAVDVEVIYVK